MKRRIARRLAVLTLAGVTLLAALGAVSAAAQEFQAFGSGSRAALEQQYRGKPFVLAFWSLDCSYCRQDLLALGEAVRRNPQLTLVTVCTDGRSGSEAAARLLDELKLPPHARWQFAEADEERLRYRIDSSWYGELPRTYYYDAAHRVSAHSGSPEPAWLQQWLKGAFKP